MITDDVMVLYRGYNVQPCRGNNIQFNPHRGCNVQLIDCQERLHCSLHLILRLFISSGEVLELHMSGTYMYIRQ